MQLREPWVHLRQPVCGPRPATCAVERTISCLACMWEEAIQKHSSLRRWINCCVAHCQPQTKPCFVGEWPSPPAYKTLFHTSCRGAQTPVKTLNPCCAGMRRALEEAKARFAVVEGDLVTLLNVWRAWQEHGCSAQWWAH